MSTVTFQETALEVNDEFYRDVAEAVWLGDIPERSFELKPEDEGEDSLQKPGKSRTIIEEYLIHMLPPSPART